MRRFEGRGFMVLAFPSDDFGREPGDADSIRAYAAKMGGRPVGG